MPSPIEIMVDKACGVATSSQSEKKDPALVLIQLADASESWYRDESAANFEAMKKAIKAWMDVCCKHE